MPLSMEDARRLGEAKLKINRSAFDFAANVAKEMEVRPADMGPMTLALGVLKLSRAEKAENIAGELTDALALVSKVEKEWRLESAGFRK